MRKYVVDSLRINFVQPVFVALFFVDSSSINNSTTKAYTHTSPGFYQLLSTTRFTQLLSVILNFYTLSPDLINKTN